MINHVSTVKGGVFRVKFLARFLGFYGTHDSDIGPLLDDRLKENLKKNPETLKGCPLFSLSCLSVRPRATEHTF